MEKKENAFVGKHYLMKQAFDQEELHRRESICTREEAPGCQAACPLHLDMRTVCAYAAKGNFAKAAGTIRAVTPFLHLLAANCSAGCVGKCTLAKLDAGIREPIGGEEEGNTSPKTCEGIFMPALEKACALYGGSGAMNRFMIPRKNKRVSVVGDGLFALACCWELGKKGYEIWWYTTCKSMQEPLIAWGLTEQEASGDLTAFSGFRVVRKEQEALPGQTGGSWEKADWDRVAGWSGESDAMCLSPELLSGRDDVARLSANGTDAQGTADDCAGQLPVNVFTASIQTEAVRILAGAKYASLLADRFIQGVALDGIKESEPYESRLHVTLDGVVGSGRAADLDVLTKENAAAEAARCIQCQCLECIKGCVYLQDFKRNPKGAIREIYNNLSIVMGNHMANGMINACDECGQCKAACPNGFDYPDVCRIARRTMVETQKMPPSAHEFALLDQQFSNGEGFLAKPQPGYEKCRYLFFPGCQAAAISPGTVEAAYEDLCERLEGGVGLLLGCCGAISHWAAREDLLAEALEKITQAWQEMGEPEIICACPTCKKTLGEFTKLPTAGIWEVLLKIGVKPVTGQDCAACGDPCPKADPGKEPAPKAAQDLVVSIHDACGARGDREMQDKIRAFVRMLGCQVEEAPFSGDVSPCCGYGGLVRYANPQMSARKASFAAGRAKHRILTYCMACRDQFSRAGMDSRHILELAYGIEPGPVPDLSQRRANRLRLKERLLKKWWKEDLYMEEMLPVVYADGVEALLDERMILKSDIDKVLKSYRQTGNAVFDEENNYLVTNSRIGNVTFWVKFAEKEDGGYLVYGAYSHRMTVE